jgi:RND family efflux transporter MFP subunit
MKRRLFIILTCIISGHACAAELPTARPVRAEIHRWITLPADLAAWQQVELRARVSGHVKSISVDKGDTVTAGQLLAEIEVPELRADLIRHRAEVTAAEIGVRRLHEAREKSPALVLPQAVDDAEARLAIAKAGLERAVTLLDFAQIKAPFAGIVVARHVDPGAYAAEGGAALLQLVDATTIRLRVPVIEAESARIAIGQPAEARVEALSGLVVKGAVSRTGFALDPASRTLLVEADLANPDGKLRPGMFATARISVERHEDALVIPVAGLVKEKASAFVFKHIAGKAVKTAVKPGFNDGAMVEVPELSESDVILLPDSMVLSDGQEVTAKLP